MTRFERWWRTARPKWWSGPPPTAPISQPTAHGPMKISLSALARLGAHARESEQKINPFKLPSYAPGVAGGAKMAMDAGQGEQLQAIFSWGYENHGLFAEGIGFMGYPYLAELTQRPEYRQPSEVMAEEMTRKWIKIKAVGDGDKSEKISALTAAMKRFKLREVFRDATELDGFFGLAFIYIDLGTGDDPDEMQTKLLVDKGKIEKGSLKGFRVVDPTWTAPNDYNSNDPLNPKFFKPQVWFVMGKQVHASRLLTILSRPVPDMLKPVYNFGGMSLSQMLKPYVDNWLRTRQSVSDLLNAFTVFTLETNMMATLMGSGGEDMDRRLAIFTGIKNTRGLLAIDKDTEALSNVSAPLGTLDRLQAQAQEHMAAPARIPLVKLFGITPSGLNASSDGEIRTFYDSIHGRQERVYGDPLKVALDVLQLNEFGEIDPDIVFEFESLWELDEAGKATVRKTNADAAAVYIADGVISPAEERSRVAAEENTLYPGLDLNIEIDPPDAPLDPNLGGGVGKEVPPNGGASDPTDLHSDADTIAEVSLNGAQVSSMLDVIAKVGSGDLPLAAAIAILTTAFPIDERQAHSLLAGVIPGGNKAPESTEAEA